MEEKERFSYILDNGGVFISLLAFATASGVISSCEFDTSNTFTQSIDIEIDINSLEYKRYLTRVGGGLIKRLPEVNFGVPVIIVKLSDETYRCYSSMCTHNNCFANESFHSPILEERDKSDVRPPIGYQEPTPDNPHPSPQSIVCRCHGSRFDPFNEGVPYQGPAERPLTQYPCSFDRESGILTIKF